ncbi:hypothetical protein RUM44_000360 [Polyplax serrata]|uniref:Ribosomal protein L9 domain-containing protein n=1 Tax=Polyplax serrata TaxID=468196 RepID=A0ABR1B6I8_POLSC
MWTNIRNVPSKLLECSKFVTQSYRSAIVFRRTREVKLNRMGTKFPKMLDKPSYFYEIIENTDRTEKPPIEMVLLKDVPGVGMIGETIKVDWYAAYNEFLLPKLAVYSDSPEADTIRRKEGEVVFSSKYCKIVQNHLLEKALQVYVNGKTNWTLQNWHIKLALRMEGIIVNDSCIILPRQEISGPNFELENKDFIVRVKMNNTEIFPVRCRLYHWKTSEMNPNVVNKSVLETESTALFPEEQEEVNFLIKEQKKIRETNEIAGKSHRAAMFKYL